jgi:hypothetical protein
MRICADPDVKSHADGRVCGSVSHFSVWTMLLKDAANKPLIDAIVRAFEDIGVPVGGAIAIGIVGLLLAVWVMFSSVYLTHLTYVEQKQFMPWHNERAQYEALNPDGGVAVLEDHETNAVLDKLAPMVQREGRRNLKRTGVVRDLVSRLETGTLDQKGASALQLQRNLALLDVDGDGTLDVPIALQQFQRHGGGGGGGGGGQVMASGKLVVDGNATRRMGTQKLASAKKRLSARASAVRDRSGGVEADQAKGERNKSCDRVTD